MSNNSRQYPQHQRGAEGVTRSDALLRKVREYFREIDTNNDNQLSREEFTKMAATIGLTGMDVGNLRRAYDRADADQSGSISFREFLDAYATSGLGEVYNNKSEHSSSPSSSHSPQHIQKPVEKRQLSSSEDAVLRKFREYFRELDVNGDNKLSKAEFTKMVASIGIDLEINDLRRAYERADTDGSGTISFKEFLDCYKNQMMLTGSQHSKDATITHNVETVPEKAATKERSSTEVVQNGCRYFWNSDQDNDGKLSLQEFTLMIQALGMKLNTRDITKAFRVADVNGSGFMQFGEYMRMYLVRITTALTFNRIKEMFAQNDSNRKGYLTRDEFRSLMKMLGNGNMDDRGLDKLISCACGTTVQGAASAKVSWKDLCEWLDIHVNK